MTRQNQYDRFNLMIRMLEEYASLSGIPIKKGEAHRPPELAAIYAEKGTGIQDSKHIYSLACDYWITKSDGRDVVLELTPQYNILGRFWEFIGGIWGGRFQSRCDMFHFEYPGKPI